MYRKIAQTLGFGPDKHEVRQARLPEAAILGLKDHQFYPDKTRMRPEFFKSVRHELLTKQTPIASMGSCFAREVKDYLVEKQYNYVQTSDSPNARHASAAWDRVYNTFCMRQEFERALDTFTPTERFWTREGVMLDPYRKAVKWESEQAMEEELAAHRRDAALALKTAEVVVVTIGINEIWHNTDDGAVFYQVPPAGLYQEKRHAFRIGTFDENLANLHRCYDLLQRANPGARMIVSVSPVPLRATFRDDCDVISASFETKCLLLAVTKQFVRACPNAHYFPGYEITWATIDDPFEDDARHVRREVVHRVMDVFDYQFIK